MLESYDPTSTTNLTAIWNINPRKQFVGTYRETGEVAATRHGFVQQPEGSAPITLDFTCQNPWLCRRAVRHGCIRHHAFGINPNGVIVGQYVLVTGGALHGFVAIPQDTN